MDKKCKICWGLLLLFLLLNIIFIGIWVSRTTVQNEPLNTEVVKKAPVERRYGQYLIKKLNMDSAQAKVYFRLKKKHAEQMRATTKQIDSLRVLLGKQVFSEEQDSVRVAELIEEITTKKMEFEWDNINHLKEIKSMLTDEQREQFDEIHKNMMMKMRRHDFGPPFRGRFNKNRKTD
ncbi:MAG: periplasmic heavy metal sensor [Chlorobi bacterium]|nr:periplasmic heavy metal sensor [Chlorobiota bacterium]